MKQHTFCFYNGPIVDEDDVVGYRSPCLRYFDDEEEVEDNAQKKHCALCAYNAIRIQVEINNAGLLEWHTICGSTTYDESVEGSLDSIRAMSITCAPDIYFVTAYNFLYQVDLLQKSFYPTEPTYNVTTGYWETFCVEST